VGNYCAAAQDASTITWKEFVDEFRRYHIPAATMKRKADEFRELQQGNKSVEEYTYQFIELARYAPEEVDKDEKKQDEASPHQGRLKSVDLSVPSVFGVIPLQSPFLSHPTSIPE
jgi:hypothetical protein